MDKKEFAHKAKLSALDLIKKKDLINQRMAKTIDIEVADLGIFTFKQPTVEIAQNAESFQGGKMQSEYIILNTCVEPNLRDKELLSSFGVVEPIEIIGKLFKRGEIARLAEEIIKATGYSETLVKLVEQVKN